MSEDPTYVPTDEDLDELSSFTQSKPSLRQEFAASLHAAQSEMSNPKKDSTNPFFDSQYLSLPQLLTSVREVLNRHDLILIQEPVNRDNMVGCTTILMHKNGYMSFHGPLLLPSKQDAQGFGAAVSYARRYALQSVLGLAGEDDDANSAVEKRTPAKISQPQPVNAASSGLERGVKVFSIGRKTSAHPFTIDTDRGEFCTYDTHIVEELEVVKATGATATFSWKYNEKFKTRDIVSPPKKKEDEE